MPAEQQFTFDEVAELYDRSRPRYPRQLFQNLVEYTGLESDARVLEVGCATGQATLPLAELGCEILCLEPGENLARIARVNFATYPKVKVQDSTFEAWPLEPDSFDLMICAQSFHWIQEEERFVKSAQLLRSGGCLAVAGNSIALERSPLLREFEDDYRAHAPLLLAPPPMNWYSKGGPLVSLFEESHDFDDVAEFHIPWSVSYDTAAYNSLLCTYSDHRLLPETQREALHGAIARRIDASGGRMEIGYVANLYVARGSDRPLTP